MAAFFALYLCFSYLVEVSPQPEPMLSRGETLNLRNKLENNENNYCDCRNGEVVYAISEIPDSFLGAAGIFMAPGMEAIDRF